ncbi:protein kinase [Streptomyces sp. NPDC058417]|uniref:serine/threonine-protein kinase n=1 Tax=unclassified Streptomyces TaxID=2593676 RepID=UPI00364F6FB9
MQGRLVAGRYRLDDAIGSGGMGRVWRAHDELLHRAVAIKELTAALYVSESDQPVLLARTRAEARAAARINHSAVVTVHDVLEHDGRPWIVMELVEGRSLADAVKEDGRIEPAEAARIGLWVLRALRAAHSAGVLHRDVKPGNVLLSDDRRVLLTDFGIAQIEGDSTITRTGEVVGSVDYLAPERVRGHDPGPASDLWALGATLYTAVEGRSPFRRTSPLTTMQAVVEEEAEQPRHAGPLAPVIAALLRKDPAHRPDTSHAEALLAEAAEGRRPDEASTHARTGPAGPATATAFAGSPGAALAEPTAAPDRHATSSTPHGAVAGTSTDATRPGPGFGPTATGPTAGGRTATGPTAVGATPVGPSPYGPPQPYAHQQPTYASGAHPPYATTAQRPHPQAQPRPAARRRGFRTFALVAALAVLVGGGTAVGVRLWGPDGGRGSGGASASESAPATGGTTQDGTPTDDAWKPVLDPLGFGLSLPKGWERTDVTDKGDLKQVDYSPDGGEHFLRVGIDTAPDFADAYDHQIDLERQLQRLVDYERVTLERNVYRDRDGAHWDYTWTALAKDTEFPGPRRAAEQMYVADGTEYVLYMSAPAEDWDTAAQQFTKALQSWREPPRSS